MKWVRAALAAAEDLLWPARLGCLLCDELSRGDWLCEECTAELAKERCLQQAEDVRSAYWYRGAAKALVHGLKFDAQADAAQVLAHAMTGEARDMSLPPDTVVTWVTMPTSRRRERGIDHGRVLSEAVAEQLQLPVKQLLKRVGRAHVQHSLNAQQRRKNLQGVFSAQGRIDVPVLLVDDVYTTGSTMQVCTEALRAAGAPQVFALTAARVPAVKEAGTSQPDE